VPGEHVENHLTLPLKYELAWLERGWPPTYFLSDGHSAGIVSRRPPSSRNAVKLVIQTDLANSEVDKYEHGKGRRSPQNRRAIFP